MSDSAPSLVGGKAKPAAAPATAAEVDENMMIIAGTAVAGLLLLVVAFAFLRRRGRGRTALGAKRGPARSKTSLLLCGPLGGGKTTIFQILRDGAGSQPRATYSSMEPNRATAADGGFPVVDFPGHPRLQGDLLREVQGAKIVVLVVDAVTAADDKHLGAVVNTVATLLECPEIAGSRLVVAAHKRDDPTSYTAKALQRLLETELTKKFGARSGDVGSVKGKSGVDSGANRLVLRAGEKFTFATGAPIETTFVDTAVPGDGHAFSMDPILEAMR